MTADIHQPTALRKTLFTAEEVRSLWTLRVRFQEDRDLFSPRERAHLLFLRWRVRTGRLVESALP
ncbi:MAG: hypothetical protein JOZ41_21095 [Chloroflexi bacterium]|nr:hypothetical protein [Chloroflexota bacterium]